MSKPTTAKKVAKAPAKTAKATKKSAAPRPKQTAAAPDGKAVQAYIELLPDWKQQMASRIDAVIRHEVPHVQRVIKWGMPFYGVEGQGWFLRFAAYSKHMNLRFFAGTTLKPEPPVGEMDRRGLHLTESDKLDEKQFASWVRQAAALPGYFA